MCTVECRWSGSLVIFTPKLTVSFVGTPAQRFLHAEHRIASLGGSHLRVPVPSLAAEAWPRQRTADLLRFAIQALERHIDRRLTSAIALNRLGA